MSQTSALATRPARGRTSAPAVATPTRHQLLMNCAAAFAKLPSINFGTLYQIEVRDEEEVRAMTVVGTPFEVVDQVLSEAGLPTDGTVGSVMDGLGVSKDEVHGLICNCLGDIITGEVAAGRFENLAAAG